MNLTDKAAVLLALHRPGIPVVVPTVWDPWSARVVAEQGFAALTIGSHPVAEALGREDGEKLSLAQMLAQVALIADSVDVPVSADLESGYSADPAEIIDGLLEAGAVGLNIEDTVHSEGDRLRSDGEHADLIHALRSAADASGVHVVINARTDILLSKVGAEDDRVDRAIRRLNRVAEAGADVLYPVGMHSAAVHRRLTSELPLPVNAIGRPGIDSLATLAAYGVARISFGPYLQRTLADLAADLLGAWRTA